MAPQSTNSIRFQACLCISQATYKKYLPICFLQTQFRFKFVSEISKVGVCTVYEMGAHILYYNSLVYIS